MATSLAIHEPPTTTSGPEVVAGPAHADRPRGISVLEWVAVGRLTVLALGAVLLLMSPPAAPATDPHTAMAQRRAEAVNVPPSGRERLVIAQRLAARSR